MRNKELELLLLEEKITHFRACFPLENKIRDTHRELYEFLQENNIRIANPQININGNRFSGIYFSHNDYVFFNDHHCVVITCNLEGIIPFLEQEFNI